MTGSAFPAPVCGESSFLMLYHDTDGLYTTTACVHNAGSEGTLGTKNVLASPSLLPHRQSMTETKLLPAT